MNERDRARKEEAARKLQITNYVLARCETYAVSKEDASSLMRTSMSAALSLTYCGLREQQRRNSMPLWQYIDVLKDRGWSESDLARYVIWFLVAEATDKMYDAEVKADAKRNFRKTMAAIKR